MKRKKKKKYVDRSHQKGVYLENGIHWFYCLCGCGNKWKINPVWKRYKKIYKNSCRYYYLRDLALCGMIPPEDWCTCLECKEPFPIFPHMNNYTYSVCPYWMLDEKGNQKMCLRTYRRKKIIEKISSI